MKTQAKLGILFSLFSLWVIAKHTVDLLVAGAFPVDLFSLVYAGYFALFVMTATRMSKRWEAVQTALVGSVSLFCLLFTDDKALPLGIIMLVFTIMLAFSYGFYARAPLVKLVATGAFVVLPLSLALLRGDPLWVSRASTWAVFTVVFFVAWWFVIENELRDRVREALGLVREVLHAWFTSDHGN